MGLSGTIMRGAIRGYQLFISPILPGSCRYWPSCSAYGMTAIARHGAIRGGWLTLRRLLRCNPWGGWGHDPVPDIDENKSCGQCGPNTGHANPPHGPEGYTNAR